MKPASLPAPAALAFFPPGANAMDELDPQDAKLLAMTRQARKNEREAMQETVDSQLAASAVMVTQLAAMDIAKLSANPFFSK